MCRMSKRIAILQSNYIPWKGYFDIINQVDEFVLYDEVQYTKSDWRNRNRIKTRDGVRWLTIPVQQSGRYGQRIDATLVSDPAWGRRHWDTIRQCYCDAPHFRTYAAIFEPLYLAASERFLSRINRTFIDAVCRVLGVETRISWSTEHPGPSGRNARLIGICRSLGADEYLSGPSGKSYLDESAFAEAGIAVRYVDYSGYPAYRQLHGPFEHAVSVLDLIFNTGPDAWNYLKTKPIRPHE